MGLTDQEKILKNRLRLSNRSIRYIPVVNTSAPSVLFSILELQYSIRLSSQAPLPSSRIEQERRQTNIPPFSLFLLSYRSFVFHFIFPLVTSYSPAIALEYVASLCFPLGCCFFFVLLIRRDLGENTRIYIYLYINYIRTRPSTYHVHIHTI